MLSHVVTVRNASGHAEAEVDAVDAFRALDVDYPVLDWGSAWDAIRSHTIEALDALREELSPLTEITAETDTGH